MVALLVSCQVDSDRSLTSARPKRAGKISDSRVCTCTSPAFCPWPRLQPIGSLRFSRVQVHFPALLYLAKISDQQTVFLSCRVFNHITSPLYCHLWGYAQNISIKRQRTNVIATSACTTGIRGGGGGKALKFVAHRATEDTRGNNLRTFEILNAMFLPWQHLSCGTNRSTEIFACQRNVWKAVRKGASVCHVRCITTYVPPAYSYAHRNYRHL